MVLSLVAVVVGFTNFFWCLAESMRLGGDGLNGYVRDGHYYVSEHGVDTEVSRSEWKMSRTHALSVFLTHPLALLGMAYLLTRYVYSSVAYGDLETMSKTVHDVRNSGPVITQARAYGSFPVRSQMHISLYPGGLMVKPHFFFMPPFALPKGGILDIQRENGWMGVGIRILHSAFGSNPIVFRLGGRSAARFADRLIAWRGQGA